MTRITKARKIWLDREKRKHYKRWLLYKSGLSVNEIAESLGYCRRTIKRSISKGSALEDEKDPIITTNNQFILQSK